MEKPDTYLAVFKGSVDPDTNFNWCSDCVKADPNIKSIVEPIVKQKGIEFY